MFKCTHSPVVSFASWLQLRRRIVLPTSDIDLGHHNHATEQLLQNDRKACSYLWLFDLAQELRKCILVSASSSRGSRHQSNYSVNQLILRSHLWYLCNYQALKSRRCFNLCHRSRTKSNQDGCVCPNVMHPGSSMHA